MAARTPAHRAAANVFRRVMSGQNRVLSELAREIRYIRRAEVTWDADRSRELARRTARVWERARTNGLEDEVAYLLRTEDGPRTVTASALLGRWRSRGG